MKRKAIILTVALLIICLLIGLSASVQSSDNYRAYANSLNLASIVDSTEITYDEIENRNGKLIIERVIGMVDDENGNGHALEDENYYICYSRVPNASKGNIICTYFVYNPDTNEADDILERFDYIIR